MNLKKLFSLLAILLFINIADARVYSGLEVFLYKYSSLVKGKRVGLVTNPTGVDARLNATVDLFMVNKQINLVALFAPEHGIRGNIKAGEQVAGGRDFKTKLPIYTLYGGRDHRPTKAALSKIDVLIYDIQDVGSRAYTYIWHLAECMSACADAGKTVIILDRPSPFGARVIDGPITEKKYLSFIGLYPIPRVYGMTVGELGNYLNHEEKINCKLTVIPMMNYVRGLPWKKTGLPWVPTSPNIPSPEAAYGFATTGTIGEVGGFNIGVGSTLPFQIVATSWIDPNFSASSLNHLKLPGVKFRPLYFTSKGTKYRGIQIHVIDPSIFHPTTTEVAILCHLKKYYPKRFAFKSSKIATFDKAMGTSRVRKQIMAGYTYKQIIVEWRKPLAVFRRKMKKYFLYK